MIISLLALVLGLLGLWIGGDIIIPAAQRIARRLKISEAVIGLTIVSIGTSVPEISSTVASGLKTLSGTDASGIAVGNIIGSCLSQITIVIGIIGFMATMYISKRSLKRDGLMMMAALLAMALAASDLFISRLEGMLLIALYLAYLVFLLKGEKIFVKSKKGVDRKGAIKDAVMILGGAFIVVISADLAVSRGVEIARLFNVKEVLIGIFVGLGTTLPELSISLKAAHEKSGALSIGNLIGSNITDPLLSLGAGASISGFSLISQTLIFDIPFWLVGTTIALLLLYNHTNLNRAEASILIVLYLFFLYLQFFIMV